MARVPNISEYFITGVQKIFFTLMLAHKHFRIFYKGVQIIIIVLMSGKYKVFKTFYLARYPTDTLF